MTPRLSRKALIGARWTCLRAVNRCLATKESFTGFLIERPTTIVKGREQEVFLSLEGDNCQPLQQQPSPHSLECLDSRYVRGMPADIEDHSGNRSGASLAGLDYVLTQRMRKTIKELAGYVLT